MDYVKPSFSGTDFHCPRCQVHAAQYWRVLSKVTKDGHRDDQKYYVSCCNKCGDVAIWYNKEMVYPTTIHG